MQQAGKTDRQRGPGRNAAALFFRRRGLGINAPESVDDNRQKQHGRIFTDRCAHIHAGQPIERKCVKSRAKQSQPFTAEHPPQHIPGDKRGCQRDGRYIKLIDAVKREAQNPQHGGRVQQQIGIHQAEGIAAAFQQVRVDPHRELPAEQPRLKPFDPAQMCAEVVAEGQVPERKRQAGQQNNAGNGHRAVPPAQAFDRERQHPHGQQHSPVSQQKEDKRG